MKTSVRRFVVVAVCGLCLWASSGHLFAADEDADTKEIALTGGAIWSGKRAPLKAVLTATGKNEYTVVYTFTWDGREQTWQGTMKGNLRSGIVTGTGATPDGRRTFVFRVRSVRGVMTGKHYETTGGRTKETGDIGLKM